MTIYKDMKGEIMYMKRKKLLATILPAFLVAVLCYNPLLIINATDEITYSDIIDSILSATDINSLEEGGHSEDDIPVDGEVPEEDDNLDSEDKHLIEEIFTDSDDIKIQVGIPTTIDFYLDPFNFGRNGTLFSPEYSIINYSNVDIELQIKDLMYTYSDNGTFLSLTEAPNRSESRDEKAVFMFLRHIVHPLIDLNGELADLTVEQLYDHRNDDFIITDNAEGEVLTIHLKAANYDDDGNFVSLNEDSVFLFTILGDIDIGSSAPWKSGDLKLSIVYSMEAVMPDFSELNIDDDLLNSDMTNDAIMDDDEIDENNGNTDNTDNSDTMDDLAPDDAPPDISD